MLAASSLTGISSRPSHMEQLHALSITSVKIWKSFESGCHNDTVTEPEYFTCIAEFINEKVMRRH
jgi:hypothetical protein